MAMGGTQRVLQNHWLQSNENLGYKVNEGELRALGGSQQGLQPH